MKQPTKKQRIGLTVRRSDNGKWQVENVPGNWITCHNEEDARILSNAPVLLGQSYSSPNEALAANLEETAQKLEDYKIGTDGFTPRLFLHQAQSVHRNCGHDYANKGKYDRAILAYTKAIQMNPKDAESHYNFAKLYLQIGNKDLALEEYEVLTTLDDELAKQLFDLIGA